MNILVCVKQVPKDEDLKLDPETKNLIRQGSGTISDYDKYAIEMAVKLKEQFGGTVTAITMGPPQAESVLRYALSVGADKVFLISDRAMGGADAYATVNVLAGAKTFLERELGEFQLVLCGKQASDSDTSLVAPQLAETLGCAQVTGVIDFSDVKDDLITVVRETDEGTDTMVVSYPAVFSLGKTVFPARYPNIRLKLAANKASITQYNAEALGLAPETLGTTGSMTVVGDSYIPTKEKTTIRIDDGSDADKAAALMELLIKSKIL